MIHSQHAEEALRIMETAPDEVVQARFWDGNDILQEIVMEFTYRFDDVLDAGKLKSSLERLLEIGEWKSLGARFRKNVGHDFGWRCRALDGTILTTMTDNDKRPGMAHPASLRREETRIRLVTRDAETEYKRTPPGLKDATSIGSQATDPLP